MTYVFLFMTGVVFIGFGLRRHRTVPQFLFSAAVCALWLLAALWWSGRIF